MIRDPTISENYIALRNALLAIQDDQSAVLSVLSSLSDGGFGWVATAYNELRRSFVQGRLQEAETVGKLIGLVLDVQEKGANDELAENRIHRESMQWLVEGIGAILNQDNLTGIKHLEQLTEAVYCNESLQWVAWLWMARAAGDEGELQQAEGAAKSALELAENIDPMARGTSLTISGEIAFLKSDQDKALDYLTKATATFEEIGDRRGMALSFLTLARMLTKIGREEEGLEVANKAQQADADWEDPPVFLSQQALIKGQLEAASEAIQPFLDFDPRPPEISRQDYLLRVVREQKVPLETVKRYLALKEGPPSAEEVEELKGLQAAHPEFLPIRELMAWSLTKLGQEKEAAAHFEQMSEMDLDPEILASVLLGLGCLANRKFEHRQPAARVRAAAAAARQSAKPAEPSKSQELKDLKEALEEPAKVNERGITGSYAAVPATGPKAVFTGDLQLFAVTDLLEFLKSSRRTGTLVVTSESGIGAVHMCNGMITGAASPNCTNMGDLLLSAGALNEEQLLSAANYQRADSPERLLGSILLEQGLVDQGTLRKVLVKQIKTAILEMIGWSMGRFAFEPDKQGQAESDQEISIELDTQEVLLDALREFDEQNRQS